MVNQTSSKVTPSTVVTKNSTSNTNVLFSNLVTVNNYLVSGNTVTKFNLVNIQTVTQGSMLNNLNVKTNLKNYKMYTITNVTMLNNRKIQTIQVYINKQGNTIITSTRLTKNGTSTNLYNHFNKTLLTHMVNNHITNYNYNK